MSIRTPGAARALLTAVAFFFCLHAPAHAADAAAEALARKSGCFKCHALDKEKVAPSYREIAKKYKDDSQAEEKLFVHLTTNPVVKVDGEDEEHTALKTRNDTEVRQVVRWIRSL